MYKLIIVDDEEEVRKGIIQKIDWKRFNFEVVGEAENGREALDLIEENVPDVVITDITMPLMDGLKLASLLKDNYPTVKTVILTGFDDFKFAQQAIKYGVADYILKPVMPKDINELIGKLETRINEEIAQKEDIVMLRKHYSESLPVIREKFLTQLISGSPEEREIKTRVCEYGLKLEGDIFAVAAVNIDSISFKNNVFEEKDMEVVKVAVMNISKEIVEKHSFGEVFFYDDNLVIIAGFRECERNSVFGRSFSVLEEIRQNIEKFLKISITIGLGRLGNSLSKLKESYRTALTALEYKLIIGGNKVIFIEDLEPLTTDNIIFDEKKEKVLISSIKFGTKDEVIKAVDILFNDIYGMKASIMDYHMYLMEITAAINKLIRSFQMDSGEIFGKDFSSYEEEFRNKSLDEIRIWVERACIILMERITSKRQNTTEILLEKAKDYIRNNYGDNELSIQKVADYLHISPSYLSMIFKKEANVTFLKYLVNIRLEVAKDLLSNNDLKTFQIAEKIGYPEINYFSYFFKKNFGMSPREYRNQFPQGKEQ